MAGDNKIYGVADRAWQPLVGCDPHMPCAPRCWARKTVARVVLCQAGENPKRSEFFKIALSPDLKRWSGQTYLDPDHLNDPLRWNRPSVVATGFHGDWGRLSYGDMVSLLTRVGQCQSHLFVMLTKQPDRVLEVVGERRWRKLNPYYVPLIPGEGTVSDLRYLPNASIGCSIMNQTDANASLDSMKYLAEAGWHTHVWYEPAIGLVDWRPWWFLKGIIFGGESGESARDCRLEWASDTLAWCRKNGVGFFMKQLGSRPVGFDGALVKLIGQDRKGERLESIPEELRVRDKFLAVPAK